MCSDCNTSLCCSDQDLDGGYSRIGGCALQEPGGQESADHRCKTLANLDIYSGCISVGIFLKIAQTLDPVGMVEQEGLLASARRLPLPLAIMVP